MSHGRKVIFMVAYFCCGGMESATFFHLKIKKTGLCRRVSCLFLSTMHMHGSIIVWNSQPEPELS